MVFVMAMVMVFIVVLVVFIVDFSRRQNSKQVFGVNQKQLFIKVLNFKRVILI